MPVNRTWYSLTDVHAYVVRALERRGSFDRVAQDARRNRARGPRRNRVWWHDVELYVLAAQREDDGLDPTYTPRTGRRITQ